MHFALVSEGEDITSRRSICFEQPVSPEALVQMVCRQTQAMIAASGNHVEIMGCGFVISRSYINYSPGDGQFGNWTSAVAIFSKVAGDILQCPFNFTLKCNTAAIAELHFGKDRLIRDLIVITMADELRGSIVSNGNIIGGHSGMAGALGYFVIRPGRAITPAARSRYSLSSFCSLRGIIDTANEIKLLYPDSELHQIPAEKISVQKVFELANMAAPAANQVLEYTGQILGEALAAFVTFSPPASIILRANLMTSNRRFIEVVKHHMDANLLPIYQGKMGLMFSSIKDKDVHFLGCSGLFR